MRWSKMVSSALGVLVLALALAACGGGSGSGGDSGSTSASADSSSGSFAAKADASIDVGDGNTIKIAKGQEPNIAVFSSTGNDWANAFNQSMVDSAEEQGVKLKVFDAGYVAQKQVDQITDATSGGKYNAFIVTALDSALVCEPLKEAASKGILVVLAVNAACAREENPWGEEYRAPGALTQVDGQNSVTYKLGWAKAVSDALPDGSKVLIAAGPQTDPNTKTFLTAIDQVLGERSDIELLKPLYGDFSTPTALNDIQDALTANSDVTAILSIYSDVARGAVQAVSQAGKDGDIKIFDIGGSRAALDEIKKGQLEFTIPFDPTGAADYSVRAIVDAYSGKTVPPVIDQFPDTVGGSVEKPLIIDASSVDGYAPVY